MTDLSDPEQFEAAYRSPAPLGSRVARRVLGEAAAAKGRIRLVLARAREHLSEVT